MIMHTGDVANRTISVSMYTHGPVNVCGTHTKYTGRHLHRLTFTDSSTTKGSVRTTFPMRGR